MVDMEGSLNSKQKHCLFLHYVPRYLYSTLLLKLNCWIFINSKTDEIQTFLFSQILFLIEVLFAELKYLKFKFYSLVNIISQHIFYWFYFTFSLKIIVWHTLKAVNENSMLCIFLVPLPFIIFFSVLMELNHLYYFYSKENLNQCKLLRKFSAIFPKKCLMTIIS